MEIIFQQFVSNPLLIPLLILTVLDFVVGLLSSLITKTTSSKIGMRGILRKILLYLSLVAVSVVAFAFTNFSYIFDVFIVFYIFNEVISILENLTECGLELPAGMFKTLKDERDKLNEQEHGQDQ